MAIQPSTSFIGELIASHASETVSIEFKAQLPERHDKGRSEYLKDVSAMANAGGGLILYGIGEVDGKADRLTGLKILADEETRRLAQIADSGIEPRIASLIFSYHELDGGDVLSIYVPESVGTPHRYNINGVSRFVKRSGTYTSELTYDELRIAFGASSDRIRAVRARWVRDLASGDTWRPMQKGPLAVTRLSMLASVDGRQLIDPKYAHQFWSSLVLPDWGGGSSAFNYEGLAVYEGGQSPEIGSYVQVDRMGTLTAYQVVGGWSDSKTIPSTYLGRFLLDSSRRMIAFARSVGLDGAAIINAGIAQVDDYELGVHDPYGFRGRSKLGTKPGMMILPDIWISSVSDVVVAEIDVDFRPGLDMIWQTFGYSECTDYDIDGRWNPKNR